jgi:hypothetical protein
MEAGRNATVLLLPQESDHGIPKRLGQFQLDR